MTTVMMNPSNEMIPITFVTIFLGKKRNI